MPEIFGKKVLKSLTAAISGAAFLLSASVTSSSAALVKSDHLVPGDGWLITDTVTGIKWLSLEATAGQSMLSVIGGYNGLVGPGGFQMALASTVRDMIANNFGNITTTPSVAQFPIVTDFFNTFGLLDSPICGNANPVSCPRSQGWAVDHATNPTTVTQLGAIQFDTNGYAIDHQNTPGVNFDLSVQQLGVWLNILPEPTGNNIPAPGTLAIVGFGLAGLGFSVRRKRRN